MRDARTFVAPMNATEAAQRAQYVLGKWRYKFWSIPNGIRFERAFAGSALFAVNPHHVHSRIDVLLSEKSDGTCEVSAEQRVYKFGQPCSNLDKLVWRGDMDDLEASLARREEPSIDRIRQDHYAASISFKYIGFVIVPVLAALFWFLFNEQYLQVAVMGTLTVATALILPRLPFKMPHFPLDNVPPPFQSNYPRGRSS